MSPMTDKPDDDKGLGAPAASRHRATDPSDGAAKASPRFASVSTGAVPFTPGPWGIERGDSVIRIFGGRIFIAGTASKTYWQRYDETDEANASLIAAAPELYAECESAALALDEAAKLLFAKGLGGCAGIMATHAERCRAALTKARGE